jgi:hypothetical protein
LLKISKSEPDKETIWHFFTLKKTDDRIEGRNLRTAFSITEKSNYTNKPF